MASPSSGDKSKRGSGVQISEWAGPGADFEIVGFRLHTKINRPKGLPLTRSTNPMLLTRLALFSLKGWEIPAQWQARLASAALGQSSLYLEVP